MNFLLRHIWNIQERIAQDRAQQLEAPKKEQQQLEADLSIMEDIQDASMGGTQLVDS